MKSIFADRWWGLSRVGKYCNDSLLPGIGLIVLLITFFYYPALFLHRTLAHGDISTVDIPFFDLLYRVVRGKASALWSNGIFGGHPLFAEGQAGLAHPLNIIWAAVVTPLVGPLYSMNLFYWLLKIVAAAGIIGLCRSLGISRGASIVGALGVIFSSVWLHEHYVLPVNQTLAWIPWSLWAFERSLQRPDLRSAALLAAACGVVFLSGYPQGIHGVAVYLLMTLTVVPFQVGARQEWREGWRPRLIVGLIASTLCIGLVAVQLLPSLELESLSYRATGIDVSLAGATPLSSYLRGVLITQYTSNASYFPGTGSILVCLLASLTLVLPVSGRVKGHVVATIFLFLLGTERASPVFRLLYDHHIIPGLHFFRQMVIYLGIAAIGVSVVAAAALDQLSKCKKPFGDSLRFARAHRYKLSLIAIVWMSALLCIPINRITIIQLAVALTGVGLFIVLARARNLTLLAPASAVLLAAEIVLLRLHPFQFFDPRILAKPPSVEAIEAVPDWQDYKFMTGSLAGVGAGLSPTLLPDLGNRIAKSFSAISPMTNLLWGLPSLNGHLALPLARRMAIEDLLHDEIFGVSKATPGLRLMDFLGIRFVTNGGEFTTPGYRTIFLDRRPLIQTIENREHWTQENTAALPRFQFYSDYKPVGSLESAIFAIKSIARPTLIIEDPAHHLVDRSNFMATTHGLPDQEKMATFRTIKATDTEYEFILTTAMPIWFFVADANYPGWTATVDGRRTQVFSAQILGKAVLIAEGTHHLKLAFKSMSFLAGLGISLASLLIWFACLFQSRLIVRLLAGLRLTMP